jgi:hypothetical protein
MKTVPVGKRSRDETDCGFPKIQFPRIEIQRSRSTDPKIKIQRSRSKDQDPKIKIPRSRSKSKIPRIKIQRSKFRGPDPTSNSQDQIPSVKFQDPPIKIKIQKDHEE